MAIIIFSIVLGIILLIQTTVLAIVAGVIDIVRGIKKQTRRK